MLQSVSFKLSTSEWHLIASFLKIDELVYLTSTCKSAKSLLAGYTLTGRTTITEGLRGWLSTTGIKTGSDVKVPKKTLQHTMSISCICFSSIIDADTGENSTKLIVGSWDGTLSAWDIDTWVCYGRLRGHEELVRTVCSVSMGRKIASGSYDRTVRIWDVKSLTCEHVLFGHFDAVKAVCLDSAGSLVSGGDDMTIRVWDVDSGLCLRKMIGHTKYVNALILIVNGYLVSGSDDCTIKVWCTAKGECMSTIDVSGGRGCVGWK